MGYPDIERARDGQAALRRIVDGHAGAGPNLRAVRRVVDVCREMSEALDDVYCQEKIHVLMEYCAELLSQGQRIDFLRQQIHATLELLQSRLYSLERARRVGQPGFARPAFGTLHPR
jgi:hypothetical protein